MSATSAGYAQETHAQQQKPTSGSANETEQTVAQTAVQAGSILDSDNGGSVGNALVSTATGAASAEVQNWLNQFGTAQVSISTDENFSLDDSSLDLLLPLYDDKKTNLFFTQLGGRRNDDRNIVNAGLGYRYTTDSWMWGVNTFYDRQISGNQHQRLGLGTELGWNYLKLSANGYLRLSDWMRSTGYDDYDERVANGFDIRATGYLPAYPQLGANIIYEQYYGDDVGLFGDDEDDRQKNPHAITFGLNYTPVPLVTVGVNQKFGKDGKDDTQINLALSWAPGVPLSSQLDPSQVAARRSVMGGRQDLVDRNNNIVLEYRKQDLISLGLPPLLEGDEHSKQSVTAKVTAKYGLDHIDWQGDSFFKNGGKVDAVSSGANQFIVTLPTWQSSGVNSYTLSATAWDKKGNASNSSQMKVNVNGVDIATLQSTTTASPATLPADGVSTSTVTVTLKTAAGEKATGLASRISATLISSGSNTHSGNSGATVKKPTMTDFKESAPGSYVATFTSGTTPDTLTVQPLIDNTTKLATAKIIEEPVSVIPELTQVATSATSTLADGASPITLTAHVVDQFGNVLKDAIIDWSADNAKAHLSDTRSTTDAQGLAQITVTGNDVFSTVITAALEQGNSMSTPSLSFTADTASAQVVGIKSEKQQVVANNMDSDTIKALVTDKNNHPLEGITVDWSIEKTDNTRIGSKTSITDSQGVALLTLKSAKAGTVEVSAGVNGQADPKETDPINFIADSSSQKVSTITLDKQSAVADGADRITYEATVTDAQGNIVPDAAISWSADSANVVLSSTQTISGSNGKSTIAVTSKKAGDVVITARTSSSTAFNADKATFTANPATAQIQVIDSDRTSALADGTDAIVITATAADANGNLLPDSNIAWSATPSGGILSASTSTTNASGVAQVTLRSETVARYDVTATINGSGKTKADLDFTVDANSAHLETLTADTTSVLANGNSAITLTAKIIDNAGHPVKDETINWSADSSSAQLSATQSTTDEQGLAQITVTSTSVIDTIVTAQHGQAEAKKTDTLHFTADTASAHVVSVNSNKTQLVANNIDTATVSATVTDDEHHPLPNITVNWAVDKTDGTTLGNRTSVTNDQGIATTELKSAKAGAVTVAADVNGQNAQRTDTITFAADSSTQKVSTVTLDKAQAVANGTDAIAYEATVTDANNNPVSGVVVTWSTNNSNALLSTTSTTSDSDGKSTITVTSLKTGDVVITAQTSEATPYQASSATFIADRTTAKVVEVKSDRQSALANGTDKMNLSAKVTDANDNLITGEDVAWSVSPSSGKLSVTASQTDASGIATATLSSQDVASYDVTASANSTSQSATGLSFTADIATAQVVSLTADKSVDVVADKDHVTLTALVQDASHHPVSNATVTWSSSDEANSTFTPASSTTDANGNATATFSTLKAGSVSVTATSGTSSQTQALQVIGNIDTADFTSVVADKSELPADGSTVVTWTALLVDANQNPLPNVDVTWTSDNSIVTLDSASSTTNASGQATTSGTAIKIGNVGMTAKLAQPAKQKTASAVKFVGDLKTAKIVTLAHDMDTAVVGSSKVTYSATVKDANDNLVEKATVNWSTTLNNLSAATSTANASGVATIKLSGNDVGYPAVTAEINGNSMTDDKVNFIAEYKGEWNINTNDSSSIYYNSVKIYGFHDLGFIALGDTDGPKELTWVSDEASTLTVPMTDTQGKTWNVVLKGYRGSDCSLHSLNSAVACYDGSAGYYARIAYSSSDNASLPAGAYHGVIQFAGKDWHTTWALNYKVTTTLTVE
ncbi:Ig-like domain-containing protein [Citrobacter koseri]|uniref:Ig-like domain-containing protein n=1 Tax=Citrobacter koseri TaxID=545 RepID=UPI0024B7869A|nr:Ig-like domain-containing protein [Citrobacter koseri]MDI9803738.1 Ig-like domain-containing protein [Citrobacter koseri]